MNTNSFFSQVPSFVNGVKTLHADLLGVCLVLAFAGLLVHVVHALLSRNQGPITAALFRLMVIAILAASLQSWGDLLVGAVQVLINDMGISGSPATVFADYQAAIARKMGTAAAAQNLSQANSAGTIQVDATGAPSLSPAPISGVVLTHLRTACCRMVPSRSSRRRACRSRRTFQRRRDLESHRSGAVLL
jgi:hypothetical protein